MGEQNLQRRFLQDNDAGESEVVWDVSEGSGEDFVITTNHESTKQQIGRAHV